MKVFLAILAVLGFITIYIFLGILTILAFSFFCAKEENISFKQAYLEMTDTSDDEDGSEVACMIAVWPFVVFIGTFAGIGRLIKKILEKIGDSLKDNKSFEDIYSQEK